MKKLITISLMLILVAGGTAVADEYQWNAAVLIGGDAMGGIGAEITREFGDYLELGFSAYAQSEVDGAQKDASGHDYHMESGYSALLIKPKLRVNEWLEIGLPLETGTGLLQYRYTGDYREEVVWTDEILDRYRTQTAAGRPRRSHTRLRLPRHRPAAHQTGRVRRTERLLGPHGLQLPFLITSSGTLPPRGGVLFSNTSKEHSTSVRK